MAWIRDYFGVSLRQVSIVLLFGWFWFFGGNLTVLRRWQRFFKTKRERERQFIIYSRAISTNGNLKSTVCVDANGIFVLAGFCSSLILGRFLFNVAIFVWFLFKQHIYIFRWGDESSLALPKSICLTWPVHMMVMLNYYELGNNSRNIFANQVQRMNWNEFRIAWNLHFHAPPKAFVQLCWITFNKFFCKKCQLCYTICHSWSSINVHVTFTDEIPHSSHYTQV